MTSNEAIGIAEGYIEEPDKERQIEAWQFLIDSGLAWQLQGFFGRRAKYLIDAGVCRQQADK